MSRKIPIILFLFAFFLFILNTSLFSLTIYAIQYTDDPNGNSPYLDSIVTVQGIATVSQGVYSAKEYYIQDGEGAWNGIMIYDADTTRNIKEGDLVEVTGKVNEYYGKTEIGYLDNVTVLSHGNKLPRAHLIPTDSVNTEPYEDVLIRCDNAVVTDLPNNYGEWRIDDGSGKCWVDDAASYSYNPALGDTILHIIGVVNYSYGNFMIEPRRDDDIILTLDGTGQATINPDSVPNGFNLNEQITVLASIDTLRKLSITIPFNWQWTGNPSDINLSGSGNIGAEYSISGSGSSSDPFVITVDSAKTTELDPSIISINNLISADAVGADTFIVKTAGIGGALTEISQEPVVTILSSDGSGQVKSVPEEVVADSTADIDFQFQNNFGVITSIELKTPIHWGWTGDSLDVSLTGDGFLNATYTIVKDESLNIYSVEIDNAGLDSLNNGLLALRNLTAPDSLDYYEFEVKTAGPQGNLVPISSYPEVLVRRSDGTIPIIAVDRNDSAGIPHLLSDYVKIQGIVTEAQEFGEQAFIQDATGGVCVYGISDYLADGDTVTVSGTVSQYYGLTELSPAVFLKSNSRGNVPAPETLTCADIAGDGNLGIEKYEGELVIIKNVETGAVSFPSDGNITISDTTGSCEVRIKKETELPGAATPDSLFDIIGIVGQYKYDSPYIGGYQLMPRSFKDIIMRGDGSGNARTAPPYIFMNDTASLSFVILAGSDTIKKVSLSIPIGWYWTGDSTDVELEGEGFNGAHTDSIAGDGITKPFEIYVSNTSLICNKEGILRLKNISPVGGRGRFSFPVKTAGRVGFLKDIYKSPYCYAVTRIDDIQHPGDNGYSSSMEGDSVCVYGVVSGPSVAFSSGGFNSFYVQDITGGVNVYSGEGRPFQVGEEVIITGVVTEYNGLTEVSTDPQNIVLLDGISDIQPTVLGLNQGIDESLEGKLVEIENGVIVTKPSITGGGKNLQIYNGRTIVDVRVGEGTGIDLSNLTVGKGVDIIGIAGQYDSDEPYTSGYQLLPRLQSDIKILGQGGNPGPFSLSVYPNPFSPDLGEILNIKVASPDPDNDRLTLKVFDLKGRLIKTIFSNIPGGSSTHYWLGK
ncbi:MAG: hypothetical protein B5M53_06580, partial [Candidatus Cloacimonas sp. 4484_209]